MGSTERRNYNHDVLYKEKMLSIKGKNVSGAELVLQEEPTESLC